MDGTRQHWSVESEPQGEIKGVTYKELQVKLKKYPMAQMSLTGEQFFRRKKTVSGTVSFSRISLAAAQRRKGKFVVKKAQFGKEGL